MPRIARASALLYNDRMPRLCVVVASLLIACGPDRSGDDTNAETSGAGSQSSEAGTSATTSDTTGTSAASTGEDEDDTNPYAECFPDGLADECPSGTACCQPSFYDPATCQEVPEGGCGGDVVCPEGFDCRTGNHCGIGECVERSVDTSEGSESDTTAGTETSTGSSDTSSG